jgi:hypothetical protein
LWRQPTPAPRHFSGQIPPFRRQTPRALNNKQSQPVHAARRLGRFSSALTSSP